MAKSFRYRNPWRSKTTDGPEFFETTKKPGQYRGFQIFNRFKGCHELVKDGVCLTQRAGGGELRELADALLGEKTKHPKWLVDRARETATEHGVSFSKPRRAA